MYTKGDKIFQIQFQRMLSEDDSFDESLFTTILG